MVALEEPCKETAFNLMQQLRAAGIRTEGGLFDKNPKAQMKQANRCGADYALIIGGNELAEQSVMLKDLTTGEQRLVRFDELIEEVKKLV